MADDCTVSGIAIWLILFQSVWLNTIDQKTIPLTVVISNCSDRIDGGFFSAVETDLFLYGFDI